MNGSEHYRKAEDLAAQAFAALTSDDSRISGQGRRMAHNMLISRAQVHATLACAAPRMDWSRTWIFTPDQVEALKALIGLVHRDELAESWWQLLPEDFREVLS